MNDHEQNAAPTCPSCGSEALLDFFHAAHIPAQDGVVWPTREKALQAPTGEIRLAFCKKCNNIYNRAYDPSKITFLDYDFSLHYSPTYQKFNEAIIGGLIERHDLRQKSILEVACGRGHFLIQLCRTGNNRGFGIDPSYEPAADLSFDPELVSFKKDYYGEKYHNLQVDFITCRHLMDELEHPVEFLKLFRQNLKGPGRGGVYIEVPNIFKTFSQKLIWNIGYAKRTWYTPYSISYQLQQAGFRVTKVGEYLNGDYLGVEAVPADGPLLPAEQADEALLAVLHQFSRAYQDGLQSWNAIFDRWSAQKKQVALWGAGMRGINFLSAFPRHEIVSTVIDINPHRQGKFLPGSAFQVMPPEVLKEREIDVLIISNATYAAEISEHARALGFRGEFEVF